MRIERLAGADGPTSVTRNGASASAPVVMRFDEPAAYVDFVAATPPGRGRLEAELVAFDADGRILDVDRGPAVGGDTITMQVTADSAVIHEAHLRITGLVRHDVVTLSQIDSGARGDYCPLSAAS